MLCAGVKSVSGEDMTNGDIIAGSKAIKALTALKGLPKNSHELQARVKNALIDVGFEVKTDVAMVYWRTMTGKVAVVARHGGGMVAIELDGRWPNKRSIGKLRAMDGYRVIALKSGATSWIPHAINAVIKLDVAL